jgi:hypothetical protein
MDFAATEMFDFQRIYEQALENAPEKSVFVEIGANMGDSTRYMARLLRDSEKDIRFYTVDPWTYPPMPLPQLAHIFKRLSELPAALAPYMLFLENMKKEDLFKYITPLRMTSALASQLFTEELDFVMLDGDHQYPSVKEDILCWRDKLREGGILAGHDYQLEPVEKAVNEMFKKSQFYLYEQYNPTPYLCHTFSWATQKLNGTFVPYEIKEV